MSEETKWTPGPWNDDRSIVIARLGRAGLNLGFIMSSSDKRMDEGEANAHLIAAAPDLYEALEYVIKQVPEFGSVPGIAEAMAKARGES